MCLPLEAARPCCQAGLRGLSAASLLPQPSRPAWLWLSPGVGCRPSFSPGVFLRN